MPGMPAAPCRIASESRQPDKARLGEGIARLDEMPRAGGIFDEFERPLGAEGGVENSSADLHTSGPMPSPWTTAMR